MGEVYGFRYHNGVVFSAYIDKAGYPLAKGGRYDGISKTEDLLRPAVGFGPVGPCKPVGPVAPSIPAGPVGPTAPSEPAAPAGPAAPWAPAGPVSPAQAVASNANTRPAINIRLSLLVIFMQLLHRI